MKLKGLKDDIDWRKEVRDFFSFKSKMGRMDFALWYVVCIGLMIFKNAILSTVFPGGFEVASDDPRRYMILIWDLVLWIPIVYLAMLQMAKRLNDVKLNRWVCLLFIVPLIALFTPLYPLASWLAIAFWMILPLLLIFTPARG